MFRNQVRLKHVNWPFQQNTVLDFPSMQSFFSLEHCITPLSSYISDFNNLPIVNVLAPYCKGTFSDRGFADIGIAV